MLSLILLAAAAPLAVPAPAVAKPACRGALPQQTDAAKAGRPRRLNEEPAATAIYTVQRSENGCTRPVPVARRR